MDYSGELDDKNYCRFDTNGYYGGSGKYINWRFIITELDGDSSEFVSDKNDGTVGCSSNIIKLDNTKPLDSNIKCSYIKDTGIDYDT